MTGPVDPGSRFVASEAYRAAHASGAFADGRLPDEVRSVEVLGEAELRSALRLRTFANLAPFDIEGVPHPGVLAVFAPLVSLVETIPVSRIQVLLAQESAEVALAGSADDGQPLPETTITFGPGPGPATKVPRFGSATPVSLATLDEPGLVASLLNRRFEMGFALGVENELLNGTGGFWTGLLNMPTTATGDATHVIGYARTGGQYRLEAIVTAAALVQANGWYTRPLQVLSHPTTKAAAKTERATTSGDPVSLPSMIGDGDVDIDHWAVSKQMPVGVAVVSDFFGAVALLQKGGLTVEMAPHHRDFLTRGLVEMKLESRLYAWLRQPPAVCVVTGL